MLNLRDESAPAKVQAKKDDLDEIDGDDSGMDADVDDEMDDDVWEDDEEMSA